jgi:hypothetical protein
MHNRIAEAVKIVMGELSAVHEQHSCIMASAVLLDVLLSIGIDGAYPLTVKPRILNPQFVRRLRTESFPTTSQQFAEWSAAGCSMVAIGHGTGTSDSWAGHLVVVVPNAYAGKAIVIDPTITQASVPDWGIELRPLMFVAPASFLQGDREFKAPVNDSMIVYMAFPSDHSYETTPLWSNRQKRDVIVRNILNQIGQ